MRSAETSGNRLLAGGAALPRALLVTMLVIAGFLAAGGAAYAASTPEEAAQALVERLETGTLEDLGGVVCPEQHDEIRAELDPTASDPAMGAIGLEVRNASVALVSEEDGIAVVNVSATLRLSFDEEQLREFVRAQLEASGQEPTEEAISLNVERMASVAGEDIPLDRDLTVIERDAEWLICDPGASGTGAFSDAGMCGLVTPAEIGALAPVEIGSNVGDGDFCQWIGASDTAYFSVDVGLVRDADLEDYRATDPSGQELTVAGLPAFASFGQLFVEVDGGVLSVVPYLEDSPGGTGTDAIGFATGVAELFVPRLGDLPDAVDGDDSGTEAVAGPLADCGVLSLDAINALGPVRYDDVSGGDGYCLFSSTDPSGGARSLSISLDPTTESVADLRGLFPGGTERKVAGRPAYAAVDILWVQLDDGMLAISPLLGESAEARDLDPGEYALDVARHVIEVLEPAG